MIRFILCVFLFAACSQPPTGLAENEISATENVSSETGQTVKFRVETVAANLEVPWDDCVRAGQSNVFHRTTGQSARYRKRKTPRRADFHRSRCRTVERKRFDGFVAASEFRRQSVCLSGLRISRGRQACSRCALQIRRQ